jgi:hypothetical protein
MRQRAQRIWVAVAVVVALIILLAFAGIGEGPNRPLAGTAKTTWLDVFTAFSPFLGALLAIGGVIATIYFTNRREQDRQENERLLKNAELEAAQAARLRDERVAAYRKLVTATTNAHTERDGVNALYEAYVEISLLGGTDDIDRAAAEVWVRYGNTQRIADLMNRDPEPATAGAEQASAGDFSQALNRAEAARDQFLKLAREELGIKDRTAGFRDLEGSDTGE